MKKRLSKLKPQDWLTKWLGGRRERLMKRLGDHEALVFEHLLTDSELVSNGEALVELCGFTLSLKYGDEGVSILAIEPPESVNGDQLGLFSDADHKKPLE